MLENKLEELNLSSDNQEAAGSCVASDFLQNRLDLLYKL